MTEPIPLGEDEIAAYVRVSSRSQDLATQRASIERAARAREDRIGTWYSEKVSGKSLARPELSRLREDVLQGKIRRVYVYKLDRLCRSGVRDMFDVVDGLHRAGCQLVAVNDALDFGNPLTAEIMVAVLAICAKVERLHINERVADARARVEAEGGHWGRPPSLDGEKLIRAQQLQAEGRSIRYIAQALKVTKSSVQRGLNRAVPKTPTGSGPSAPSEQ